MNTRVLELLKNPKNIQSEDLNLLKEEINSFPYIQNIRALHLYGVHLYDKENYQKELSITAAYTTDKKILYQLINGKIQQLPKPEITKQVKEDITVPVQQVETISDEVKTKTEIETETENREEKSPYEEAACLLQKPQSEIKHVYVDGERNRILFEGEENFLNEENSEKIDLESTLESGTIVTQKQEKITGSDEPENAVLGEEDSKAEQIAEFTPETIIEEDEKSSEAKQDIENSSELSFHETEPLLPEVDIRSNGNIEEKTGNGQEKIGENFDKTKESQQFTPETIIEDDKKPLEAKREIDNSSELSFHETESFLPEVTIQSDNNIDKEKVEEKAGEVEAISQFTSETIIEEEKIATEPEKKSVRDDSELSFHGLDSFLPEVKIHAVNSEETIKAEASKANVNKHEEEMRRLIEEVEKKMKAKKETSSEKKLEEPEIVSHDISFAETQTFHIETREEKEREESPQVESKTENTGNIQKESGKEIVPEKPATEIQNETKSVWKPMNLDSNIPDSLINKKTEISQPKQEIVQEAPKQENVLPATEKMPEPVKDNSEEFGTVTDGLEKDKQAPKTQTEEVPVMNVSFFGSDISSLKISESEKTKNEVEETGENSSENIIKPLDSNIPGFINTWQNWLKIDRTEENEKSKTEIKNKAIDSFIENNPKISQLKNEVNFVVKEKTDDISHLMTETLAKLYFEQKLYTKAINAYGILAEKHPEKKEYFEGKIQEIKDLRGKN